MISESRTAVAGRLADIFIWAVLIVEVLYLGVRVAAWALRGFSVAGI